MYEAAYNSIHVCMHNMEDRKRENPTKIIAISVQMSMRKIIKVLAN